jgi:hypothetical protein
LSAPGTINRGIAMALSIPGRDIVVQSGDVFSGLTVGAYGAYFLSIEVQSGGTVIDTIGQYTASEFAVSNDGHGGTLITFEASSSTTTVTGGNGNGHGHG